MPDPGATFRALHRPGAPFILANVWDAGSARMMAAMGAAALATSSAAHAFTLGRPDGQVTRDEALAHAETLVAATPLPVQGDFENGYGDAPEVCAETVRLAAEIGLAGICIEDVTPDGTPYPADLAAERIRAAAAAARALPGDFVLTARADGVMHSTYDMEEAIARVQAFEAAGADVLYAPVLPSMEETARLIASVSKPVNVLMIRYADRSLAEFAAIGAARVSLGSALARAVHGTILEAGTEMFGEGRFTRLGAGASGAQVDEMLGRYA
ncbi:isocitrate lyase/PEP mutase family protein [Pseudoroseicyclus tamaricis]|uniref:Isocitrate lyase/phosphoenolpyruvate mutase family protein n=1 Tax=Pseudoroseicyclus tamaricis TaxID=2705421 RepID=A0A6B2JTV5_9RHOB|nr:isocitrate lyase/phosphoenolpyruvate mutase family protein [Pseudoroseicyclus tamaricis]NDV01718.1 isocitrate lyase/phosphoenolpyruvate mutase family protein [Pseudoroseicyclus tamaricis]